MLFLQTRRLQIAPCAARNYSANNTGWDLLPMPFLPHKRPRFSEKTDSGC